MSKKLAVRVISVGGTSLLPQYGKPETDRTYIVTNPNNSHKAKNFFSGIGHKPMNVEDRQRRTNVVTNKHNIRKSQ